MKILVANYRYFVSGGPERYMFNAMESLESLGHSTIPFSINYSKNIKSSYSGYFAPPIGAGDEVYFRDQRRSLSMVTETLRRSFYSRSVEEHLDRLIEVEKPDIAYVLHYLRKLSPSILVSLKKHHIPIVVRISDYQMLCPQAHMLRSDKPCSLCLNKGIHKSIQNRCVQNSLSASLINALATWYHRWKRYFDLIDRFVVTNEFMLELMVASGYSRSRIVLLPTFSSLAPPRSAYALGDRNAITYLGRLDNTKGVHHLVRAFNIFLKVRNEATWELHILGTGDPEYEAKLRSDCIALGVADRVRFGFLGTQTEVSEALQRSAFSVVPSIWYESLPNSLLGSLSSGVPVIASRIGSLEHAFEHGIQGLHFRPGDEDDLAKQIVRLWDNRVDLPTISAAARELAGTRYSSDTHVRKLVETFNNLLSPKV